MTPQPDLFTARARPTDPHTSHEAAVSVNGLRPKQHAVLRVFNDRGSLTLENLVILYKYWHYQPPQSDSGIRTRASELVAQGRLRNTGRTAKTSSGRNAIIWEAV